MWILSPAPKEEKNGIARAGRIHCSFQPLDSKNFKNGILLETSAQNYKIVNKRALGCWKTGLSLPFKFNRRTN